MEEELLLEFLLDQQPGYREQEKNVEFTVKYTENQDIDPKHDHADARECNRIEGREQNDSSKPQVQCHSPPHCVKKSDQQQCVRKEKKRHCSNMALPGSIYCEKHHSEREAYNEKRRKEPKRESRYIAFLPSGQLRCRRTGKRWQCDKMASHGLYCDKHQEQEDVRNNNRRKGSRRPNRALMSLLSLDQEQSKYPGNEGSNSDQLTGLKMTREDNRGSDVEDIMTNPNHDDEVKQASTEPVESGELTIHQKCHRGGSRWDCSEMALPGKLYCDRHQLERDAYNKRRRKGPKKQNPSGDGRCRRAGKGWRCLGIASPGIYCVKHQLERDIHNEQRRKGPKRPSKMEDVRGIKIKDVMPSPNSNDCGKEVSSDAVDPERAGTRRRSGRKRLREKDTVPDDIMSGFGEVAMKKCGGVSFNDEDEESGGFGKQITAILEPQADEQTSEMIPENSTEDPICKISSSEIADMVPTEDASRIDIIVTEKISSMQNVQPVSILSEEPQNPTSTDTMLQKLSKSPMKRKESQKLSNGDQFQNAIVEDEQMMLPFLSDHNTDEDLQENEVISFCKQMEIVPGLQSTVYVGDIPIPAELQQIYKEIKDRHGPLENGQSVDEIESLPHNRATEKLKYLAMDSVT